uniref:Uncharacterized protein n=1 Tax=Lates calcarifer TaxID=8187 RepID=A0A4W6DY04_LATCA
MSSSVSTTTGGVVVVTHVHPTPQDGEPQRPVGIQKFVKGRPMILGTIQIIIGLMTLLFGIVMAINANTLGVFSGFFVWGALIVSCITFMTLITASEIYIQRIFLFVSVAVHRSWISDSGCWEISEPLSGDRCYGSQYHSSSCWLCCGHHLLHGYCMDFRI